MQNTGQLQQPAQNISAQQPVGYAVSHHPSDIPLHAIPQCVSYLSVLGAMIVSYVALAVTALLLLKLLFPGASFCWIAMILYFASVGVYSDAKLLKVGKGHLRGVFDRTYMEWFVGCLLCWPLVFPAYLAARPAYKRIARGPDAPRFMTTLGTHGPTTGPMAFIFYARAVVIEGPTAGAIIAIVLLVAAATLFST